MRPAFAGPSCAGSRLDGHLSSILLAASRGNPSSVLKDGASTYKVDTDAIAAKVRQECTANEKAKKTTQPTPKRAEKAA